jgi:hypothetical protein
MTENLPGDDALFKTTVLRRPADFKPGERPRVSLHLLVKNVAARVEEVPECS